MHGKGLVAIRQRRPLHASPACRRAPAAAAPTIRDAGTVRLATPAPYRGRQQLCRCGQPPKNIAVTCRYVSNNLSLQAKTQVTYKPVTNALDSFSAVYPFCTVKRVL